MRTKVLLEEINCTGCLACVDSCPQKCIEVDKDKYGFIVPHIDESNCINCNKCIKICPSRKLVKTNVPKKSYVAFYNNEKVYNISSSGGAFAGIATSFINSGGLVCGASYISEKNYVQHIVIDQINSIESIQGSKYVQSFTNGVYLEIGKYLKQNKKVLFSGTPCQVAAANSIFGKNTNLFTIEIICHGVSNNDFLSKCTTYTCGSQPIKNLRFRLKNKYHKSAFILQAIQYDGNKRIQPAHKDVYFRMYIDGKIYRPSCYKCMYAQKNRGADMTIGDCSTYKDYDYINPEKELSTIVINTNKGEELWELGKKDFVYDIQNMNKEFSQN